MAGHNEITVGSKEWVVRLQGQDCPIVIEQKKRKPNGRGFEFVIRRVDAQGVPFGRRMTKGSGSLRKPGAPVKAFGGKSPTPPRFAGKKSAPARTITPEPAKQPKPTRPPVARKNQKPKTSPNPAPQAPSAILSSPPTATSGQSWPSYSPPSYSPPELPSLRGRGRSSSAPSRSAPARTKPVGSGREEITVRPRSEKIKRVIRGLEKLPENADDWMIKNTVLTVLSEYNVFTAWGG